MSGASSCLDLEPPPAPRLHRERRPAVGANAGPSSAIRILRWLATPPSLSRCESSSCHISHLREARGVTHFTTVTTSAKPPPFTPVCHLPSAYWLQADARANRHNARLRSGRHSGVPELAFPSRSRPRRTVPTTTQPPLRSPAHQRRIHCISATRRHGQFPGCGSR
jgi:hypothetical protein